MINKQALSELADLIEGSPDNFDMQQFVTLPYDDDGDEIKGVSDEELAQAFVEHKCGYAACVGGFMALHQNMNPNGMSTYHFTNLAVDRYGLTRDQAHDLFYGNTFSDNGIISRSVQLADITHEHAVELLRGAVEGRYTL